MSYDTISNFKIDLKNNVISGKRTQSNVRDWRGRKFKEYFEQWFESQEELENHLIRWANAYLDGTAKFPPSSTFSKRVDYIVNNGLAYDKKDRGLSSITWYEIEDGKEVRDILTGRKKITTKYYAIVVRSSNSRNGYNMVLKNGKSRISLSAIGNYRETLTYEEIIEKSKGTRRLSKLRKETMEWIKENHKQFLEDNHAEVIEL